MLKIKLKKKSALRAKVKKVPQKALNVLKIKSGTLKKNSGASRRKKVIKNNIKKKLPERKIGRFAVNFPSNLIKINYYVIKKNSAASRPKIL